MKHLSDNKDYKTSVFGILILKQFRNEFLQANTLNY